MLNFVPHCSLSSVKINLQGEQTETGVFGRDCRVKNSIKKKQGQLIVSSQEICMLKPRNNLCSGFLHCFFWNLKDSWMQCLSLFVERIFLIWWLKRQFQTMLLSIFDHSIDFLGSCFQTLLLLPCLHLLFQVNFFSYVALATAALPTLEKNRGALVVVSSLAGWWLYLE